MHLPDWSIRVLKSPFFQQTVPLLIIFLVPAFFLLAATQLRRLRLNKLVSGFSRGLSMGLESLGISLPWLWSSSSQVASSSSSGSHGKRHKKKSSGSKSLKSVRTRAEQIAMNSLGKHSKADISTTDSDYDDALYYPGLVNISGTYCFMNSTLQALASLTYLQPYIDAIHAKAEALDVPTPVIDALQELFKNLNTPKSTYHSLRPHAIISALSSPSPASNSMTSYHSSSSLFNSREHQDAQELFQLVSECVKNEMSAVDREGLRDRGIAGVLDLDKSKGKEDEEGLESRGLSSKSVFDGLTANRRSCVMCGYTEAVMHFGFDNWQLAVPRLSTSCRLDDCLEDYTRLEILKDCICRKCSVLATHKRLLQELKTLEEALVPTSPATGTSTPSSSSPFSPGSPAATSTAMPSTSPQKSKPSQSKKKRYKEVKRMEQRVRTALAEGRIEEDALLEGVRLEKVVSPASTKQAMIARPPPVLALHLNRSMHYGQYATKNNIRVYFPEVLDLTPYTTSGSLSTVPTSSISTPAPPPAASSSSYQVHISDSAHSSASSTISGSSRSESAAASASGHPRRSTTPTPETYAPGTQRTIYRLAAVVCHYGQHSFGHYICYRRKPRRVGGKWVPPTLVDPLRMEMDDDEAEAEMEGNRAEKPSSKQAGKKKPNGGAVTVTGDVDYFGAPMYYWEDHTEEEVGTNRGWLRISDDSVAECGIESVLAEGSGAFMLYYERAVHPKPGPYLRGRTASGKAAAANGRVERERLGTSRSPSQIRRSRAEDGVGPDEGGADTDPDGDAFSIGSEETLKPELRVVDLNGSIGSLISEVGVGVMKVHKKDKEREKERERTKAAKELKEREKEKERTKESMSMSMHLPLSSSSKAFGPRIIRSVNAGRRSATPPNGVVSVPSSDTGSPSPPPTQAIQPPNGSALHEHSGLQAEEEEKVPPEMIASAPSILSSFSSSTMKEDKVHSRPGLGSKLTRVMHHPPAASSLGVKAR